MNAMVLFAEYTGGSVMCPTPALLRKILLVDDERDGAELAAELLRAHGLSVRVANSADEALQVLQEDGDIDALLTDVMMPDMTGLQLAQTVRIKYPTMRIVLMSGYVLPDLLRENEQPFLFAAKPYRIDSIINLLHS